MTRIIGLDPSVAAFGLAQSDGQLAVVKTGEGDKRLVQIHSRIVSMAIGADLAVIEQLPQHLKAAGITGMAQGVARLTLLQLGVPYLLVAPTSLKVYATGKGNATKADMRMEWFKRTGEDVRDDNKVDAAWLRQIGLALMDETKAIRLPSAHTRALGKLMPDFRSLGLRAAPTVLDR